jgi:hypothetical protein
LLVLFVIVEQSLARPMLDLYRLPTYVGLMMLLVGVPLFIGSRLVSGHLAHWLSGRALLALGLALDAFGPHRPACVANMLR